MAIKTRVEYNRFAAIAGELTRGAGDVVNETVEALGSAIERDAPVGSTGRLGDRVQRVRARVTRRNRWEGGIRLAFYWFFQEFGTSRQPARPFVYPAAELERPQFERRLSSLFDRVPLR